MSECKLLILQLVLENQSSFIQENNIPAFGAVEIYHGFFLSYRLSRHINWYSSAFFFMV